MPNTVRLYHFICDHWAAENVKSQRLKLSFPNLVNDIFEFQPFDFGIGGQGRLLRKAWRRQIDKYSMSQGFISFSESWSVPTMWGHYANNHRGVCLGFDLPIRRDDQAAYGDKVVYVDALHPMDNRVHTDDEYNLKMVDIARKTKSRHWSYEEEWRYWFSLTDIEKEQKNANPEQLFFANFDVNLVLREVIIGAKSSHTAEGFKEFLHPTDDVKFTTARPSFRRFMMVPQQNEKYQK